MKNIYFKIATVVITSFFLSASWFLNFFPFLFITIGIALLFFFEKKYLNKKIGLYNFLATYLVFILWNVFSVWWIWLASPIGATLTFFANGIIMCLVFIISSKVSKIIKKPFVGVFIPFWISYELFHHNWDLEYPWLVFGNSILNTIKLIQWYEFTGVLGGSLWLIINGFFLYKTFFFVYKKTKILIFKYAIYTIFSFLIPSIFSFYIYNTTSSVSEKKINTLLLQPNLDPYKHKYTKSKKEILDNIINLSNSFNNDSIDLIISPETSITYKLNERFINSAIPINKIKKILLDKQEFLTGITTEKTYKDSTNIPEYARYYKPGKIWYGFYNSALFFNDTSNIKIYNKSKLTPAVEKLPFLKLIKFSNNLSIDLGGIVGSLGYQKEREVFRDYEKKYSIAPIICYESVFGQHITEFIKKGANVLAVITNDGWWGDSEGYRQHLSFSKARAIETRRYIVRSANTGYTVMINNKGEIIKKIPVWSKSALVCSPYLFEDITFYSKHGDYIGKICLFISFIWIVIFLYRFFKKQ